MSNSNRHHEHRHRVLFDAMEFSRMTHKWSTKPSEANSARIRDNQRRHRARMKARTALLETRLADTQSQLQEALAQNAKLLSELEALRAHYAGKSTTGEVASASRSSDTAVAAPSTTDQWKTHATTLLSNATDTGNMSQREPALPALKSTATPTTSQTPVDQSNSSVSEGNSKSSTCGGVRCAASRVTTTSAEWDGLSAEEFATLRAACSRLPPPTATESTIPCDTAYDLIRQHNHAGEDLAAINVLLAPGFRGSTSQGDGCRVESSRVFAVIDFINPL